VVPREEAGQNACHCASHGTRGCSPKASARVITQQTTSATRAASPTDRQRRDGPVAVRRRGAAGRHSWADAVERGCFGAEAGDNRFDFQAISPRRGRILPSPLTRSTTRGACSAPLDVLVSLPEMLARAAPKPAAITKRYMVDPSQEMELHPEHEWVQTVGCAVMRNMATGGEANRQIALRGGIAGTPSTRHASRAEGPAPLTRCSPAAD
jgi:hypothetical protein